MVKTRLNYIGLTLKMFLLVSITNLFITQAFIKHTPEHFVCQPTRGHIGILCEPSSLFLWERAVELIGGRGVEGDRQRW